MSLNNTFGAEEDIVERLRNARSREDSFVCNEAANEIESLRAQLANEKRAATEIYQALENSRAQLAEVTRERNALKTVPMKYRRMKFNAELQEESAKLTQELLATQAHAARLVEALETCKARTIMGGGPMCEVSFYFDEAKVQKALSTPINLDALHEDRARTLEVAAKNWIYGSTFSVLNQMAAAHRAKKSG